MSNTEIAEASYGALVIAVLLCAVMVGSGLLAAGRRTRWWKTPAVVVAVYAAIGGAVFDVALLAFVPRVLSLPALVVLAACTGFMAVLLRCGKARNTAIRLSAGAAGAHLALIAPVASRWPFEPWSLVLGSVAGAVAVAVLAGRWRESALPKAAGAIWPAFVFAGLFGLPVAFHAVILSLFVLAVPFLPAPRREPLMEPRAGHPPYSRPVEVARSSCAAPPTPRSRRVMVLVIGAQLRGWVHWSAVAERQPTSVWDIVTEMRLTGCAYAACDPLSEPGRVLRQFTAAGCDLPVIAYADGNALTWDRGRAVRARWELVDGHLLIVRDGRCETVEPGDDVSGDELVRVAMVVGDDVFREVHEIAARKCVRGAIPAPERAGIELVVDQRWRPADSDALIAAGYEFVVQLRPGRSAVVWGRDGRPRRSAWRRAGDELDVKALGSLRLN